MKGNWADRSDTELLRESADGAAFAALYRRHVAAVHGWLGRRVDWAASDLTAETFARAWLNRRRFRDQRDGSALPWLLGIARNVLRDSDKTDRIETRARAKLGLPLDLAPFRPPRPRPLPRRAPRRGRRRGDGCRPR